MSRVQEERVWMYRLSLFISCALAITFLGLWTSSFFVGYLFVPWNTHQWVVRVGISNGSYDLESIDPDPILGTQPGPVFIVYPQEAEFEVEQFWFTYYYDDVDSRNFIFPAWIPFAIAVLWSYTVWTRRLRAKPIEGRCPACGYDLRGSKGSTTCPECGEAIPEKLAGEGGC